MVFSVICGHVCIHLTDLSIYLTSKFLDLFISTSSTLLMSHAKHCLRQKLLCNSRWLKQTWKSLKKFPIPAWELSWVTHSMGFLPASLWLSSSLFPLIPPSRVLLSLLQPLLHLLRLRVYINLWATGEKDWNFPCPRYSVHTHRFAERMNTWNEQAENKVLVETQKTLPTSKNYLARDLTITW